LKQLLAFPQGRSQSRACRGWAGRLEIRGGDSLPQGEIVKLSTGVALLCAVALGACSSGGSSGSGSTGGSPTPTPAPAPTPTPTPTGYLTFNQLTGVVTLDSANSGYLTSYDPPEPVGVNPYGEGLRFDYDVSHQGYAIRNAPGGGVSETFVASELDTTAPAGTNRYVKPNGNYFAIATPSGAAYQYIRFIDYLTDVTPPGFRIVSLTGIPTRVADIPASGTVSYTHTVLAGDAYVRDHGVTTQYTLARSTMMISVDYSAKRVAAHIVLIGTPKAGGADVTFATIDGTTDFDGDTPSITYSSTLFPTKDILPIAGALFGPQGAEAGLIFSLTAFNSPAGTSLGLVAVGAGMR
jgi:hypothetical protein